MNDNSRLKDMSSMNESSYFFDELNKDEEALHNCSTVKAYNMWPHIINQGKIFSYEMQFLYLIAQLVTTSLNPQKNLEMK
jgi:hypothetical protein